MVGTNRGTLFAAILLLVALKQSPRAAEVYSSHYLGWGNQAKDINDHGQLAGEYLDTIQMAIYYDGSR